MGLRDSFSNFVVERVLSNVWTAFICGAGMTTWAAFNETGPHAVTLGLVCWASVQVALSHFPDARDRVSARLLLRRRRKFLWKALAEGEALYDLLVMANADQEPNTWKIADTVQALDGFYHDIELVLSSISRPKLLRFKAPPGLENHALAHQQPEGLRLRLDMLAEIVRELDAEAFLFP